jgi:L-fuconolactonase
MLVRPVHLPVALKLVRKFPRQPFVVDHIAKPLIKDRRIEPWQRDLEALAQFENVYCKLSGMVTETVWRAWRPEDFTPYLDIVLNAFGIDRVMIGSDWPVCTLSGDYRGVMEIVIKYLQGLSAGDQEKVLGGNCSRFYRVEK